MLLLGLNLGVYQSVLVDINDFFDLGGAYSGLLVAIFFLGALFVPVLAGELSDRIGKKFVLIISCIIFIAGIVIVTQATNIITCGIGVFFIGSGACTIEALLSAVITDENPGSSEKVMNFSQLFFCIGAVAGPMLSLAARTLGASWQIIMLIVAAIFIPALISLFFLDETRKLNAQKDKHEKAFSKTLVKDARFLLFFFSMFLYVGAESGIAFSIIGYFSDINHNILTGEMALSLFWFGMIIGRLCAGLLHKISNTLMIVCLSGSAAFSFLLQFSHQAIFSTALFLLLGLSFSAVWPLLMAFCTQTFSRFSGTAGGLMVTGGALGGMSLPMLMGVIAEMSEIRVSFLVSTFAMIVILALYLIGRRKQEKYTQTANISPGEFLYEKPPTDDAC